MTLPMMQGMAMMFNPAMMGADGRKLEKIANQKAMVKYSEVQKTGEVTIMVANRFMVNVEGSGIAKADLVAYAEKIDYQKMMNLP